MAEISWYVYGTYHISTWFAQIARPSATHFIRVFDDGGNEVLTVDVSTFPDVIYLGDTLTITTSTSFFTNRMYYLLADSGARVHVFVWSGHVCICLCVCVHACVHANEQKGRQKCMHTRVPVCLPICRACLYHCIHLNCTCRCCCCCSILPNWVGCHNTSHWMAIWSHWYRFISSSTFICTA